MIGPVGLGPKQNLTRTRSEQHVTISSMNYRHNPKVVVTDLENELVLLDPQSKQMFSLNAVGRTLWMALPDGLELAVERIHQEFEVGLEVARQDADKLIAELTRSGLLEVT